MSIEPTSSPAPAASQEAAAHEADAPLALPKGRACPCGHDTSSHMVSPSGEYTFLGWCMILTGISADPKAVKWTCRRCQAQIFRTTDPAIIKNTRLFG